jgi:hypothetical protein
MRHSAETAPLRTQGLVSLEVVVKRGCLNVSVEGHSRDRGEDAKPLLLFPDLLLDSHVV